jgi:hypothetical protein
MLRTLVVSSHCELHQTALTCVTTVCVEMSLPLSYLEVA